MRIFAEILFSKLVLASQRFPHQLRLASLSERAYGYARKVRGEEDNTAHGLRKISKEVVIRMRWDFVSLAAMNFYC